MPYIVNEVYPSCCTNCECYHYDHERGLGDNGDICRAGGGNMYGELTHDIDKSRADNCPLIEVIKVEGKWLEVKP